MAAEKNALEGLIGKNLHSQNSLIENLKVSPGYEKALDALLGDELYHSLDAKSDIHWKKIPIDSVEHTLPEGVEPLSKFVKGSDVLTERLNQTGLVKKENVEGLISKIKYGQRLVSKEGDVWRWDGLVVTAGAPGSAAERLAQRNRLIMIHQEIDDFIKKCGTQDEIRKKIQEHQNNLSNLKLKVERIGLNKKKTSEVKERRKVASEQIDILKERIIKFEEENENLSNEPKDVDNKKIELSEKISQSRKNSNESNDRLAKKENSLRLVAEEIRNLSDQESRLREQKGRIEATYESGNSRLLEISELIKKEHKSDVSNFLEKIDISSNQEDTEDITNTIDRYKTERDSLGGVNLKAEEESEEIKERANEIKSEKNDLEEAIKKLRTGINDLNREGRERMQRAFLEVNEKFQNVFKKFFGGGNAELKFIDSDDPLEAGLEVFAQLPGKKLIEMSSLSGGEKGLVSLSLIFAVFLTNPSPICVLDEVDAALDDSNVEKFCDLIEEISSNFKTRFIVITHHRFRMARMDRLYGVTMQEKGVSQLVSVDLNVAEKIRNIA